MTITNREVVLGSSLGIIMATDPLTGWKPWNLGVLGVWAVVTLAFCLREIDRRVE